MSTTDQIEIIDAQGDIRFHDLAGRGITNIGRHPDNDIVIESPVVSPFHAILDHQQKPYRIVALNPDGQIKVSGQVLEPNKPRELRNWDTIELDGCSLILMEGGPASGAPAPSILPAALPTAIPPLTPSAVLPAGAVPAPQAGAPGDLPDLDELDRLLATLPEDRSDDVIIVECLAQNAAIDPNHPSALDFQTDVEQSATMQINVTNGGDLVGEFVCEVRGLDPMWVAISPASINLNDGGRGSFGIAITAPRLPSSRARAYYFSVVVTSPNFPGRMNSIGGLLVLKPFYAYAVGDVDPKKQRISWSKRVGQAIIPIANEGNDAALFMVSGEDDRHAADIEFDSPEEGLKLLGQVQAKVQPEQSASVPIFITPRKRRFVAFGGEDIQYSVTVTPLGGDQVTPRTVLGQARSLPLIGPVPIFLLAVMLLLLLVWIFTPRINTFNSDNQTIAAGQDVVLSWSTSPFAALHIDPDVGKVDGPQGSTTVSPLDSLTYTLVAQTFLTPLYPPWFTARRDVSVVVNPLFPKIKSFTITDNGVLVEGVHGAPLEGVLVGDTVTVSWEVEQVDSLLLKINDAPQTIPSTQFIGSQSFTLNNDTTFTLQAINHYKPDGITKSIVVKVAVPPATPYPVPVLKQFSVVPQTITVGDEVTLTWEVQGVDKVTISTVDQELPPSGSLIVRPGANASYVLTGSTPDGQKVTSAPYQVIVNPLPTPTPVPQTPKIEFFLANPVQVALGSPESKNIQLTWSVTGDITSIEITGPNGAKFSGLTAKGALVVSTDKPTLYVLTAANGALSTSQTAQIKVVNPVPKITSINPSSSVDVGGGGFVLVINGSGFVKNSQVQWAGTNRTTQYVSGTQLTASILAEDLVQAGTFEVKVTNVPAGGGTSGSVTFTLNNPAPAISGLTPPNKIKGQPGFTLTVNGSNFIQGSVINFGGVDLTTTYVSSTELSAQVAAAQINVAGNPAVIVNNPSPGGGPSAPASPAFEVFASFPRPSINTNPLGLSPSSVDAGVGIQIITITGSGYVAGSSLVRWGTTLLRPTVTTSSTMTVSVPAANLASVGPVGVTVVNPTLGFNDSNQVFFQVKGVGLSVTVDPPGNPGDPADSVRKNDVVMATVSLSSPQALTRTITLGSSNTAVLTIRGASAGPTPTCAVNNPLLPTIDIVPPATTAKFCLQGVSAGTVNVIASLPTVPGSTVGIQGVQVLAFPPTLSSVTVPDNLAGGPILALDNSSIGVGAGFDLTLNGSGFENGATVQWNSGLPNQCNLSASFVSPSQIIASVPSTCVNTLGTLPVNVPITAKNSDSAVSTPLTFQVLAPTLVSISPDTKVAGESLFDLDVFGTNFATTSSVNWNGTQQPTDFLTSQHLIAHIPSSNIVDAVTDAVKVLSPSYSANCTFPTPITPPLNTATDCQFLAVSAPTLSLSPDTTISVNGTTPVITVTISQAQSVSRAVILSTNNNHAVLRVWDSNTSACTNSALGGQITISPAPSTSATFCAFGSDAGSTVVTATLAIIASPPATPATATVTVNPLVTSVAVLQSLPSSGNPVTGQPITFSVSVTAAGGTPTGSVNVVDLSTSAVLCASAATQLTNGQVNCVVNNGLVSNNGASRTIQATYAASDSNFQTGTTGSLSLTVNRADTTSSLTKSFNGTVPATTIYGQTLLLAASVDAAAPGTGNPTGTINLMNNGTTQLSTGSSSTNLEGLDLTPATPLNAGTYSLTAAYQGNAAYNTSTSSPAQAHTVTTAITSTTISSSKSSSKYGEAVTFTATVTNTDSTGVSPTGTVAFTANSVSIKVACDAVALTSSGLNTSTAQCPITTELSAVSSPYSVSAAFTSSPANFNNSAASSPVIQTVSPATTTITLSSSDANNTTFYGQSVTLTATVTNTDTNTPPTGVVAFTADSSSIRPACDSVTLTLGAGNTSTAACTFTTELNVTNSPYILVAAYTASPANFVDTTSAAISHTINPQVTLTNVSAYATPIEVGGGADSASEFQFSVALSGGSIPSSRTINLTQTNPTSPTRLTFTDCTSPPAAANMITQVTIPANSTASVTFCAVGVAAGTARVTATLVGSGNDSDQSSTITVNNPTLSLSTCPSSSTSGGTTVTLTLTISARQLTGTSIAVASSAMSNGTVVSPQSIAAGSLTRNFVVTKASNGTTNITADLPAALGGGGATPNPCNVTFVP